MLRTTTFLFAVLVAAPAWAEGPAHDPRLERVAWEMAETEGSPRVLGWSVEVVGENRIVLSGSWPEGYRIELTTEDPLSSSPFFASDNATQRMGVSLHHPDGVCSLGMDDNEAGERAQMMVMRMGDGAVAGNVSLTLRCFGASTPLSIPVSIVPGG